jgi:hypothetical protein
MSHTVQVVSMDAVTIREGFCSFQEKEVSGGETPFDLSFDCVAS